MRGLKTFMGRPTRSHRAEKGSWVSFMRGEGGGWFRCWVKDVEWAGKDV